MLKKVVFHVLLFLAAGISVFLLWFLATQKATSYYENPGDCVIVIHGLGRTTRMTQNLTDHLANQGYRAINLEYPSTQKSIYSIAENHLDPVIKDHCQGPDRKVHFVTHSLGGIVVREYLARHSPQNPGRVVMLAPPNQGSRLAQLVSLLPLAPRIAPPALLELGTTPSKSVPLSLGPGSFSLGIIAGNKSINPLYSWLIPGPDDGKVAIKETRLSTMDDFLLLRESHTFIARSNQTRQAVVAFLKTGTFHSSDDKSLHQK